MELYFLEQTSYIGSQVTIHDSSMSILSYLHCCTQQVVESPYAITSEFTCEVYYLAN